MENPGILLGSAYDMFEQEAADVAAFKEWRDEQLQIEVTAHDGVTKYYLWPEVLREARTPAQGSGNYQATQMTLALLKAQAAACIEKMHSNRAALADKLTSQGGENAFGNQQDAHARTQGIDGSNDRCENKFARGDFVMRTYRKISILNASGIIQQGSAHDFDRELKIVSDRRKRKAPSADTEPDEVRPCGFFWTLGVKFRAALVTVARHEVGSAIKVGRQEKVAHDDEKLSRREEAVQRQLAIVTEKYAAALELYDQWKAQGVTSEAELDGILQGKSISARIAELRRQIEMRTVGCGWREFETKWTFFADEKQHTFDELRAMLLEDVIPHELTMRRLKKLPKEAAVPPLRTCLIKGLGTQDADAAALESVSFFNVAILYAKALEARARREREGISDAVEALQPNKPPELDCRLSGKRVEICWPYKEVRWPYPPPHETHSYLPTSSPV